MNQDPFEDLDRRYFDASSANRSDPYSDLDAKHSGQKQENKQGIVGDVVDAAQAGFYGGIKNIADLTESTLGVGESVRDWAKGREEAQFEEMSPAGREAMSKPIFEGGDKWYEVGLGEGASDPRTWAMKIANTLGMQADMLVPGALVTKGAKAALGVSAKKLEKEAAELAVKNKITKEVAQKLVERKARAATMTAQAIGYGSAETGVTAGGVLGDVRETILNLAPEVIVESDKFAESYYRIKDASPDLSHEAVFDQARAATAEEAAKVAAAKTAPFTFLFGAAVGGFYDNLFKTAGKEGFIKTAGKGFATEALQEAPQSGVEHYFSKEAVRDYGDKSVDPKQGLGAAMAEGGVLGGLTGGAIAGGAHTVGRVMGRGRQEEVAPPVSDQPESRAKGGLTRVDESFAINDPQLAADVVEPVSPDLGVVSLRGLTARRGAGEFTTDMPGYVKPVDTAAVAQQTAAKQRQETADSLKKIEGYQKGLEAAKSAFDSAQQEQDRQKAKDLENLASVAKDTRYQETMDRAEALSRVNPPEEPRLKQAFQTAERPQHQDGDIVRSNGQPFGGKGSAELYIKSKKLDGHVPVQVGPKAWVVRKSKYFDGRLERPEYRRHLESLVEKAPTSTGKEINPRLDELMTAIAKAGGVSIAEAKAQGIDPAHFKDLPGRANPFRTEGKSFDGMAEILSQHGYFEGGQYSGNTLLDKMFHSLGGNSVYSTFADYDALEARATLAAEGMTTEQVGEALRKALNGERLGVRQARVVGQMLNDLAAEQGRQDEGFQADAQRARQKTHDAFMEQQRQKMRDMRQKAREMAERRARDNLGIPPVEAYADDYADIAGEVFEEDAYTPEMGVEARTIYELLHEAEEAGATREEIEVIVESGKPDPEVAVDLWVLIGAKRNEKQRGPQPRDEAGPGEVAAGQGRGVQAEAEEARQVAGSDVRPEPGSNRGRKEVAQPTKETPPKSGVSASKESALDRALRSAGIDPNAPPDKAKELRRKAEKLAREAHQMLERIPPGQPVMSTRDRNLREKSGEKMRKADEFWRQAEEIEKNRNIDTAAHEAATSPKNDHPEPTDAQKKAGNYKVGRVNVGGLNISIENPEGSERSGVDPNGKRWTRTLKSHYGYLRGAAEGKDGDALDVFVKPGTPEDYSGPVFVIDQKKANGHFDETKSMIGWNTEEEARAAYLENYDEGWTGFGAITKMELPEFREWTKSADHSASVSRGKTEVADASLRIEDLSEKAIIVKGDIEAHTDRLKALRGMRNKKQGGWVYPKKREAEVREALKDLIAGGEAQATKTKPDFSEKALRDEYHYNEAVSAYSHSARNPRTSAQAHRDSYVNKVRGALEELTPLAETDAQKVVLNDRLEAFKAEYLRRDKSVLNARSGVMSWQIAGRSKFNSKQAQRRGDAFDRASEAFSKWTKEAVADIKQAVLDVRTNEQRQRDNDAAAKKASDKEFNGYISTIAGAIGAMTQPEFDKAAFRPKATAALKDALAHDKARTLEMLEKIDKRVQADGGLEKIIGARSEFWKIYQGALRDASKEQSTDISADTKQREAAPDKGKRADAYGDKNKVFTKSDADKARELLRKKLGQLNAGIDPEMMQAGITLAGYHIEAGARKFSDFAKAMIEDLGDAVRPYLKSWYMGVKYDPRAASLEGLSSAAEVEDADTDVINKDGGRENAASGGRGVERDSRNADAQDSMGEEVVSDEPGRTDKSGRKRVRSADEGSESDSGDLFSDYEAAAAGERGDFSPFAEPPGTEGSATGSDDSERGDNVGVQGPAIESVSTEAVEKIATGFGDLAAKRKAQKGAESVPTKVADKANIDETLPFLNDGQRSDVLFAENRFSKPDGYGVLFTNGTGTGKTFTGLGIIKRFARQGKDNIIIVVPSDKIAVDWVSSAKNLRLDIESLSDTKSNGGKGIIVTTYANFGQNKTLADRNWDLVVTDESHYLMQAKDGKDTNAISTLRAISLHPRGAYDRARMINRDLLDKIDDLSGRLATEIDDVAKNRKDDDGTADRLNEQLDKLRAEWDEARQLVENAVKDNQGEKRTRVAFLSATPFAYEKSVDYAEGYLFDYPEAGRIGNSNQGGFEKFMVEHFGYRIRYHKLTEPGPEVNRGLMQRQFNSMLKNQGVLSGRMLDVDADYDRRFILAESAVGIKIDEGLKWLWDNKRYYPLWSAIQKKFDHLSRRYLLEAIKAKEIVPLVRAQLEAGRKVVIFHDFKKGGAFNPFRLHDLRDDATLHPEYDSEGKPLKNADGTPVEIRTSALVREFENARPDLQQLPISGLPSPIAALQGAFPDILLFNGDISKTDRRKAVELFQDDNSGRNLILVQSAAGKEGISLHDTTGKYQRALFNLGLPTQPTTAIQQEGRIYRTGQVSNAMFRYLNTGTNWERFAFADTIAKRSSTAENLALGEQARALLDGFIQAYEESDAYPVGHEGEGIGGKARDAAANAALTEWDRAMTMYFAQHKKTSRTKAMEGTSYLATPEPLGLKMVEWADIRNGDEALEPSAGHGAIARWLPDNVARTVVEPSAELASRLKMVVGDAKVLQEDFEDLHIVNKYDAIVMNPPFNGPNGVGSKLAFEHLAKAAQHLRDGGRIVALIPRGSGDKRFDKWMYETDEKGKRTEASKSSENIYLAAEINLPPVTFERAGTKVATRIVVLEKQTDKDKAAEIIQQSRDYSDATTIKEFFERIKDASIRPRVTPAKETQAASGEKSAGSASEEGLFKVAQTKHAKKGIDLYVATLTKRVERDEYTRLNGIAKKHGGYYSAYKAQGAIPGFQFESEDARAAFIGEATKETDDGVAMYSRKQRSRPRTDWGNFPNAVIHLPSGSLQAHVDYDAAKSGDTAAAGRLVLDVVTDEHIDRIASAIGDARPIVVSVHAEERVSVNKIPHAYAWLLSQRLALPLDEAIFQAQKIGRGGSDGLYRLANHPTFEGDVQAGKDYLIVDDTLTQGGTIAALKGYIEANGGRVVLASTLTGKQYSAKLAPSEDVLSALREKWPGLEDWWIGEFGYGYEALTESEARYLARLKVPGIDALREKILAARQARDDQGVESAFPSSGQDPGGITSRRASHREPAAGGSSVSDIHQSLESRFGKRAERIEVVQSENELPDDGDRKKSGIAGVFFKKGATKIYLVADNLTPESAPRVALHEALHSALENDPKLQARKDALMKRLRVMQRFSRRGKGRLAQWFKEAEAAVPKDTKPEHRLEEIGAYAVEAWEKRPSSLPQMVAKWAQDLIATVRMALVKAGLFTPRIVTPADLAALARSWLKRMPAVEGMVFDSATGAVHSRKPAKDVTKTKAFKDWFKGSKVVDENGEPLVVYHGTTNGGFAAFSEATKGRRTGHSPEDVGFHFTDSPDYADTYSEGYKVETIEFYRQMFGEDPAAVKLPRAAMTYPVYLSIENPLIVDASKKIDRNLIGKAKADGYDGIIAGMGGAMEYVAFRPEQIKSAIGNRGTFDPNDSRILYSRRQAGDAAKSKYAEQNRRIREEHVTAWAKGKKWLKRQFTPGGLLPDKVFREKIKRDSEFEAIEFDVAHMIGRLETAIKRDYGEKARNLDEMTQRLLSDVMTGNVAENVPDGTKAALLGMRQYIDGLTMQYLDVLASQANDLIAESERVREEQRALSKERKAIEDTEENEDVRNKLLKGIRSKVAEANARQAEAMAKADMIETIRANVGEYVHRSYRAFDDKNWARKVPDEVLDNAREYLLDRYAESGMTEAEAARRVEVVLNEILKHGTAYESMEGFIRESKLGAKDLSVLKKRKQVAPEIRALLGEYTDPRINFSKSATKMGRLIFNQKFLDRVLELGQGEFLWTDETKPPEATVQIAGEKSEVYAPLNGMWTTPDVAQAFKDALGKEQMEDWYRTIVQLNGMVKYGKTVLSPTTAARNWMSAFFFSVANGHFDMRHMAKSISGLREYFGHGGDAKKLAYLRELKHLGVVYDTPYAGEMMRLLADSRIEDTLLLGKGKLDFKQALEYATKFYQYGDDFWKIIGFENEKRRWLKMGLPEQEAKEKAAERIRNTYPTYSMVGRGIQSLRRFPLAGTFVSFPAEIIRTSGNMLRYLAQDMKDPKTRPMAKQRAVGLAIAGSFAYALQAVSMAMLGYDDDDDEAVRQMAAPWQRNSNLLYTGRDKDGNIRYLDISFLDPYNYWKRPIMAIARNQPWEDSARDVAKEMLLPFLGVDIAAGAIFEVLANKKESGAPVYKEHDEVQNQAADIVNHLRKALQPGIASNLERTWKAIEGDVSPSGRKYDKFDEAAAWVGFRMSTLDPKVALYYRSFEFKDAKAEASKKLRDVIREQKGVDSDDLQDAFTLTLRLRKKAYNEMILLVNAAEKSGMSKSDIARTLKNSGISGQDIVAIINGKVPKWRPGPSEIQEMARKARTAFGPGADKEVVKRYREVMSYARSSG